MGPAPPPVPDQLVRLHLLDQPSVGPVAGPLQPLTPRDALLLALLALDGPQTREALAAWLWPTRSAAQQRANLRQRLRRLQHIGTHPLLLAPASARVALADTVTVDLHDPDASGRLLGAWAPDDERTLGWLQRARARLITRAADHLARAIDACEAQGDLEGALDRARRWIALDPLQEAAVRRLMALHHQRGEWAPALAAYDALRRRLQRRLDAPPTATTSALARALRTAATAARSARGRTLPADRDAALALTLARPPRLIGREAAWSALRRASADRAILLIHGPAGVGRSRLMEAAAEAFGWQRHRPPPAGDASGLPDAADLDTLAATAAAAGGVVVDDLQALDPGGHATLRALHARAGVPMLLAWRGAADAPALAAWRATPGVQTLALAPWPAPALESLADDLSAALGLGPLDAAARTAWAQALHRHAGGLPRDTLATLRAVADDPAAGDGPLRPDRGAPAAWPLPAEAVDALTRWLDAQEPAVRALAEIAAVAGEAGDETLFAALDDTLPEARADDAADARDSTIARDAASRVLAQAGAWSGRGPTAMVAAAALPGLAPTRAVRLEAAIARWRAARGDPAAAVAAAWARVGQDERAAEAHARAACDAAARSRQQEAADHWARAAAAWQRAGRPAAAFSARAAMAENALVGGDTARGAAEVEPLLAAATNSREGAMAHRLQTLVATYTARWDEAITASRRTIAAARLAGEPAWEADAWLMQALAAASLGRRAEAQAALNAEAALGLPAEGTAGAGQAAPSADPVADGWRTALQRHQLAANVWHRLGRHDAAQVRTAQSLALSERPEARAERYVLLGNSAANLLALDRREAAYAHACEGLDEATRQGQASGMTGANLRMHVGMIGASLGRFDSAVTALEQAAADLRAQGLDRLALTADHHLAQVWITLGQTARALALVGRDPPGLSAIHRLRRWTLRRALHDALGVGAANEPWPNGGVDVDAGVLAAARLAEALARPGPDAVVATARWLEAAGADAEGTAVTPRLAAMARAALLLRAAALDDHAAVAQHLPALAGHLATHPPDSAWHAQASLALHAGWTLLGEDARARAAADAGLAWMLTVTRLHLPPAWRHGFLLRHRMHAALRRVALSDGRT